MSFPHDSDATDSSAAQPAHMGDHADAVTASEDAGTANAEASADESVLADNETTAAGYPAEEHAAVAEQPHLQELGDDALAPAADLPIRLPTFEGPLDLLLFLIRRNEIDIYDIPIESVTRQYMQVLHSMKELDLEVAGDFFVMAATLMYIKSRMLLPTNEQVAQPQEEEEEADPRWELVQQLLEYKKYKEAALELQTLVERRQDFLERYYQQEQISDIERELEPADKIELWNTFNKVLRRLSERIVKGEIQDEEISISQSMEYILDAVKTRESFRFTEILVGKRLTVAFLVSTFLAVLELTRLKRLYIVQDAVYGEIECTRRDNPEDEGEDISEAEREEAMAPRKAARERKEAAAAAALAAASGDGASGSGKRNSALNGAADLGDNDAEGDEGEDDGFQPGDDDFNWDDFGGRPAAKNAEGTDEAEEPDAADDEAASSESATSDDAASDDAAEDADSTLQEASDEDDDSEDWDENDSEDDAFDDESDDADAEDTVWDEDGDDDADADWEDDDNATDGSDAEDDAPDADKDDDDDTQYRQTD